MNNKGEPEQYAEAIWEDLTRFNISPEQHKELCLWIFGKLINDGGGDTATRLYYSLGRNHIKETK